MQIDIDFERDLTDIPFKNPNEKLGKGAECVLNITSWTLSICFGEVQLFFYNGSHIESIFLNEVIIGSQNL